LQQRAWHITGSIAEVALLQGEEEEDQDDGSSSPPVLCHSSSVIIINADIGLIVLGEREEEERR